MSYYIFSNLTSVLTDISSSSNPERHLLESEMGYVLSLTPSSRPPDSHAVTPMESLSREPSVVSISLRRTHTHRDTRTHTPFLLRNASLIDTERT